MRPGARWIFTLLTASALLLGGCRKSEVTAAPAGESCGLTDDGGVFDVAGRGDGIYGVSGDRLSAKPLASVERIVRTAQGVDPASNKGWIEMRLADDDARALRDFTADLSNEKKIAVVAGGQIGSIHKVRQTIASADIRVSCCDPRVCDRWNAMLSIPKSR